MDNFFVINIKILKGSGIFPPQSKLKHRRILIWIFNVFCVTYAMIFFTIAELASLKTSSQNINDLVKNLNMSMSFILTLCKISVWFWNYKELRRIMTVLQFTATSFKKVKDFDPEMIILTDKKIKDRLTYTFLSLSFLVPTSACVLTLANVATTHSKDGGADQIKLPYHSYVPFDYQSSLMSYCCAVVYQCLALLICGMITVGFDMLFYSIVCFTSTHLKLLQGAFRTIKEKVEMDFVGTANHKIHELQAKTYCELRVCIQHLQLVLEICDKLESIFNILTLLQILISLVVFCTCLYILSSLPIGSNVFGNEIMYMLAIENQLALYCYAGNKLTTRAGEIPNAIYSSDWVTATSKSYRTNVLFTMMRMTKPIHLTAGKFTAMTLATFVTIGRGSYSLLAVLKNSKT